MEKIKQKRINKKHFIIYNNNGIISASTPKEWARANQNYFPKYSFTISKTTPTVIVIEKYLLNQLKFRKIENDEIAICYPYKNI